VRWWRALERDRQVRKEGEGATLTISRNMLSTNFERLIKTKTKKESCLAEKNPNNR